MNFKKYVANWLHTKKLKKLGITEEEWQKHQDPNHNPNADSIRQFYHGYKYLHEFTNTQHFPFTNFSSLTQAINTLHHWCNENCISSWREDILRVHKQSGINWNNSIEETWFLNELNGKDVLFYAFKNEQDFLMFKLKWT